MAHMATKITCTLTQHQNAAPQYSSFKGASGDEVEVLKFSIDDNSPATKIKITKLNPIILYLKTSPEYGDSRLSPISHIAGDIIKSRTQRKNNLYGFITIHSSIPQGTTPRFRPVFILKRFLYKVNSGPGGSLNLFKC